MEINLEYIDNSSLGKDMLKIISAMMPVRGAR